VQIHIALSKTSPRRSHTEIDQHTDSDESNRSLTEGFQGSLERPPGIDQVVD
jgi:hypothetical protein